MKVREFKTNCEIMSQCRVFKVHQLLQHWEPIGGYTVSLIDLHSRLEKRLKLTLQLAVEAYRVGGR
jgi:hypothetical protein